MALIDVNWNPPPRQLRQFAVLFLIVFGALGTILFLNGKPLVVARTLWSLSAVVGISGAIFPVVVRPVYLTMMALALPIGLVVSSLLMLVIYYLILTPIGLILRVTGHDPMGRRRNPTRTSYWIERSPAEGIARYFKQY